MATRKTYNLLPTVFQTDTNKKFLAATVDQLVTDPNLETLYGYIGRKFAPTYKTTDSYVIEPTAERQDYQLEPGVVIRDDQNNITFVASYIDLLDKINYYGGLTNDQSRLFDNEYYTYDPKVSFDKLINFSQYYWLPNGPDPVAVNTNGIPLNETYTVTRDSANGRYTFVDSNGAVDNSIIFARGGTYNFVVDQAGYPFWIQTELGTAGVLVATPTISSRSVSGVTNNGADVGTITFKVPQSTAQDRWITMPTVYNVDYAIPALYNQIANKTVSQFLAAFPQYASLSGSLNGKYLVFTSQETDDTYWTNPVVHDNDGNVVVGYDAGTIVASNERFGVWRIVFVDAGITKDGADDPLVKLIFTQTIGTNEKVYVKYGYDNANKEFYKDYDGLLHETPLITAPLNQLWIQDGIRADIYTGIKVVNYAAWEIDVDADIIGQLNYTSPNGVEFTSGLKIEFGTDVIPTTYQGNQYYVEQVGAGIKLVPITDLVTPETYNDQLATLYPDELFPDYITINRASSDLNPWSRSNRWFHIDVILATAQYNSTVAVLDNTARAQRPIIQFATNYQLINSGRIGKAPVQVLDDTITNAFTDLQGKTYTTVFGIEIVDSDGNVVYPDGLRVIFAADNDPVVKNKIYVLNLVQYSVDSLGFPSGPLYIDLTKATDGDISAYDTTVVTLGKYKGKQWWYDGINWQQSQQKEYLQQAPLFDVLDNSSKSLSTYTRSTFTGTQIFGYVRNTSGTADTVLSKGAEAGLVQPVYDSNKQPVYNFILSYKNFSTQGDIKLQNYFDTDTFSYIDSATNLIVTNKINLNFIQKIVDATTLKPENTWLTVPESSKQYQLISYVYDGTNYPFAIDVTPAADERSIPYVKVFKNFTYQQRTQWSISTDNKISLTTVPTVGDQIDILVYSPDISSLGFYQIPQNLDLNAQNFDLTTLTLGQMRNHLVALAQNSTEVVTDVLGQSNLRDLEIIQQGGTILQHSAPVPYASLFLIDDRANYINALRYAQQEYTKFKNKFLELSISLQGIDATDPVASVDLILTKINSFKNKSFPWYYSDMVPYGTLKTVVGGNSGFVIYDPLKTNYDIDEFFSTDELSNRAVLVYKNDVQLINTIDYAFSTTTPSIDFLTSLTVGDVIKIVEYANTDGNYIPETPSKLGLWPSYTPERFLDDTYRTPTYVIRGHDGSITPSFNDYRDDFLLELEKRIFNNIKVPLNNTFNYIFASIPNKFRTTDYTLTELNQLISPAFLNWIGNNKLDYTLNDTFEPNDAFTWNYGTSQDKIDGETLPGSWRACYFYFYDTYRPHLTPWEMLGFATKPSWWEGFYGPAPYTGANKVLWDDLEAGYVRYGDTQGIDVNFKRPGLSEIIPVDENGNLLPPSQVLCKVFNSKRSASAWSIGQQGPVEYAWRTSSEWPFAAQQAIALAKPAKYFGSLFDSYAYTTINPLFSLTVDSLGNQTIGEQFLDKNTNHHVTQSVIDYNGHTTTSGTARTAGYINWIAEYLINQGVNPTTYLLPLIQNFNVNLVYKVAGYTDHKYIEVLAEQVSPTSTNDSILIPSENYKVYLNDNPVPVDKMIYSSVIVEKTNNGFSVRGYDLFNSYFTIIPSLVNNNASRITVLNSSVAIYNNYQNLKLNVPYGYEFTTQQQVADFLISYERYLIAQGFTFTEIEPQLNQIKDWKLSVKEFLYWAQQGWKPGSILVLSPVSNTLSAITSGSITAGIEDSQYGSKVLDQNFNLIKNNNYTVYRTPTEFKLTLNNSASVVGYVEVNLVQYEHTLVFDNSTVFNDVIYQPESGNRQFRLKLIGQRTANWDGSLSPEGYMYSSGIVDSWNQGKDYLQGDLVQYKNNYYTALQNIAASATFQFQYWKQISSSEIQKGLLPNFGTIAVESQSYYDSYGKIRDKEQMAFSHALIGFKERQYLADLGLTETTQIEFYKGYIQQKGSKNAVDAFTKANINNLTSNISLYEEWAVRVGEYGALNSNPFVEIVLDEKAFGVNPSVARLVSDADNNLGNGVTIFNKSQLYKSYNQTGANIALNRNSNSDYQNDIPTAGYVNVADVDAQIFDLANYIDLDGKIAEMGSGYRIWCAKDFSQQWNVYRITETNNHVVQVANSLNNRVTFTTNKPHGLVANSVFLVKNFSTEFDGFYQVYKVIDSKNLLVNYVGSTANLTTLAGNGILLRLDSMRFAYMEDARVYGLDNPPNGWKLGDKLWVDNGSNIDQWAVYEKQSPWTYDQEITKGSSEYAADGFGTTIKLSRNGLIVVIGAPSAVNSTGSNVGAVSTFLRDYNGTYSEGFVLSPLGSNTHAFGQTIELAQDNSGNTVVAVGAPDSASGNGYVYIYNKDASGLTFNISQIIPGYSGDSFGSSLALDQVGDWLYIGAPDNNKVYAYGKKRFVPYEKQIVSVSNKNTLYLSSNLTVSPSDTIIQANTGARATVLSVVSNTEIVVDNLTNFVVASLAWGNGIVLSGNVVYSANLSVLSSGNLAVRDVYPFNFISNAVVNSVNLAFTPNQANDANSILINSRSKTYIPYADYTLSGSTVNFTANIEQTDLTIVQQPYYARISNITLANSFANFGYSVASSLDGSRVVIGAPTDSVANSANVLVPNAGAVYVYDRVIEAFNAIVDAVAGSGGQDYQTVNNIASVYKVTIDGVEVNNYLVVAANKIRFIEPPTAGQVIEVECNTFGLTETLVAVDPTTELRSHIQANAQFGTSVTICSNNCSIYVGSPYYNKSTDYNSGGVWAFRNSGRLYGSNSGHALDPQFTANDSLLVNNFEVIAHPRMASVTLSSDDFASAVALTSLANVYVCGNVLTVSSAIRANVGQVISQDQGGGVYANTIVLTDTPVTGSKYITVCGNVALGGMSSATQFKYGSGNIVTVGGSATSAYPMVGLDSLVQEINNRDILGVTAANVGGYLNISSNVTIVAQRLHIAAGTVSSGSQGILTAADLHVFAPIQIITDPYGAYGSEEEIGGGEFFGTSVRLDSSASLLSIGADGGSTVEETVFDLATTVNATTFDQHTTRMIDSIPNTGAVYLFEVYSDPRQTADHPDRLIFAQQLDTGDLTTGGRFGSAVDIQNNVMVVTSPGGNLPGEARGTGTAHLFKNLTTNRGWEPIRQQQATVDIDSLSRSYLYDTQTNTIKTDLQFIDPAKGRILGQADENITFKTEYDPAFYNKGANVSANINEGIYWNNSQVGLVWWDLSTVRYVDYEQDTLTYRSLYWGQMFEGSTVNVYEWVESTVLPSQYVATFPDQGTPRYPDDSAYVDVTYVDPVTGIITSKYYFWIKDETTLDENLPGRSLPVKSIADYITNPKNQGIPYAAVIRSDAIAFYNVADYLSSTNTVMHLDYQLVINTDIIHSEYQLVQKGNPNSPIPANLVNKLIDSFAGMDRFGAAVPDPTLSVANRYGISIRPRQGMFVNRYDAIREMVAYVNSIFAVNPMSELFDLTPLNEQDPEPNFKLGEYNQRVATEAELAYIDLTELSPGYLVLVAQDTTQDNLWVLYELDANKQWTINKVQAYKTSLYWNYIDWYASGYSAATKPDFSADTTVDALKLGAVPGAIIYIKNATGNGTWQLVIVDTDNTLKVVGIQNGTIELDPTLGNFSANELGFGNQDFDTSRFDQNPNNEIRVIINALYNDLFTNTLQGEFNNLFFVMVNYLLTEQNYVDWLFKSSFVSITHKLRTLSQFPSYVVDNQTYYQNYIEEVKPYRTKIREYLLNYTGNDSYNGSVTDFDLPAYYDTSTGYGIFRSPSGELPYTSRDEALWQTWPYNQWYDNRTLSLSTILLEDVGANYATPPTVTITSIDGNGSGAEAYAILGNGGAISEIRVTSAGTGYTQTPTVTINGSATTQANAYAVMHNPMVRTFDSTIKFDRVTYTSNVKAWAANTTYTQTGFDANGRVISGDIVTYAQQDGNVMIRRAYFVNSNITTSASFISNDYTVCPSDYFDNANDRIIGYYEPDTLMPVVDVVTANITLSNSASATNTIYIFPSSIVAKNMYISGTGVQSAYISEIVGNVNSMVSALGTITGNLTSNIASIEGVTSLGNINVGQYVFGPGIPFETTVVSFNANTHSVTLSNKVTSTSTGATVSYGGVPVKVSQVTLSTTVTLSTNDTVFARYDNLEQLVPGVTYPGPVVKGTSFKLSPLFGRNFDIAAFDPVQYRSDGMALLSSTAYDVALYSMYSNVALGTSPEDIITNGGQYVDTYHSRAPEELVPGITYDTLDMRIYTKINGNANIVAYRIFDNMMDDPAYYRISSANATTLSANLSITDGNIFVANAAVLPDPNPLFARPGIIFINGERVTYYVKDTVNNRLGQIRRGTQGTGVANVHVTGANVVAATTAEILPGTAYGNLVVFANVFYNPGSGTATDGTGFEGSTEPAVLDMKAWPAG